METKKTGLDEEMISQDGKRWINKYLVSGIVINVRNELIFSFAELTRMIQREAKISPNIYFDFMAKVVVLTGLLHGKIKNLKKKDKLKNRAEGHLKAMGRYYNGKALQYRDMKECYAFLLDMLARKGYDDDSAQSDEESLLSQI